MQRILLAAAILVAMALPAQAHKLNLFATVKGDRIEGEAYDAAGVRLKDAKVELLRDHVRLAETRTDANGNFALPVKGAFDHRLVLDTGDGHRAEFIVRTAEIVSLATPLHVSEQLPETGTPPSQDPAQPAAAPDDIDRRVEQALARQLAPLRMQLAESENSVRIRDILGAIGYILGITGIIAFLRARRARSG